MDKEVKVAAGGKPAGRFKPKQSPLLRCRVSRSRAKDDVVPGDLIEALRRRVPGLSDETLADQANLAQLVWLVGTKSRAHKELKGFTSIPYQELERRFGRTGFKKLNARLKIFVATQWSFEKHLTRGYRLMPKVAALVEDYLHELPSQPVRLFAANGLEIHSLPGAIAAKDNKGNTARVWKGALLPNRVAVDVGALEAMHGNLKAKLADATLSCAERGRCEYSSHFILRVLRLSNTVIAESGFVPVRYVGYESGRLYAQGVSLQVAPRDIKRTALNRQWEYDIENAHFDIFTQMAAERGLDCPHIRHYTSNKQAVRSMLARELDLTIDQVKACLLSAMYGARASERGANAIPHAIGQEKSRALYRHPIFRDILTEIKQGRELILRYAPTHRGFMGNAADKGIAVKKSAPQRLAHLVQGVEARMLAVVVRMYGQHLGLVQHDGWTSAQRLDVRGMEDQIYSEVGFRVRISEEQLSLPEEAKLPGLQAA